MSRFVYVALCLALLLTIVSCKKEENPAKAYPSTTPGVTVPQGQLLTNPQQVSYAIGLNIGQNLFRQGFTPEMYEADVELILDGLRDVLAGKPSKLTPEQLQTAMQEYQAKAQEKLTKQREEQQRPIKEAAEKMAELGRKEGVKTTESGLQYEVLTEGSGAKPKATDKVKVHYKGILLDGKVFGDTFKTGQPVTLSLGGVIPGWSEGLQLMPVGSKYRFHVPPQLGYGEKGSPPVVPPHAILLFEIELLGIENGG